MNSEFGNFSQLLGEKWALVQGWYAIFPGCGARGDVSVTSVKVKTQHKLCLYMDICFLFVWLFVCLFVFLLVCLFVLFCFFVFVFVLFCFLFVCLFLFVCVFVCLFVCLFVWVFFFWLFRQFTPVYIHIGFKKCWNMPRWFALPQHDIKAGDGGHTTYNFGCAKSGNHREHGELLMGSNGVCLLFHQLLDRFRWNKFRTVVLFQNKRIKGFNYVANSPLPRKKKVQGVSTGDPSWKTTAFAGKLCFDFSDAGCTRPKCKFNHKCAQCFTIGHGAQKCGKGGRYKWTHT